MEGETGFVVAVCTGALAGFVLPQGLLSHMTAFRAMCFVAARVFFELEFVWKALPTIPFVLKGIDAMIVLYLAYAASDHVWPKTDPSQNPHWLNHYTWLLEMGSCTVYLLMYAPDSLRYSVSLVAGLISVVLLRPAVGIAVFFANGNRAVQHHAVIDAANGDVRPARNAQPLIAQILGPAARPHIRHQRVQRLLR